MHTHVAAPGAALGASDPTRRWALDLGDGARFPGVTPEEADRFGPALAALPAPARAGALLPVRLPVLLTDGAGPHLLDVDGRLLLAVGPHGALPGARVVMGAEGPGWERVGVAHPGPGEGLWSWAAWARVPPAARVPALDALLEARDGQGLAAWRDRWAGSPPPAG